MTSSANGYFDSRARMASGSLLTTAAPMAPPASLQDDRSEDTRLNSSHCDLSRMPSSA